MKEYLEPSAVINSDHPVVIDYARRSLRGSTNQIEQAIRLYLAVRDGIRYDPYSPFWLPDHYKASYVFERGRGFCVQKASLLCALGRACGIPSRVGFANVRNHLATRQLLELLGTDLMLYHAFVEFFLQEKWVKCTPAFNRELCERHNVAPLEFDGVNDSLFQPCNSEKKKFMEYVELLGVYSDIPVSQLVDAWKKTYGKAYFEKVKQLFVEREDGSLSDFENEEIWNE